VVAVDTPREADLAEDDTLSNRHDIVQSREGVVLLLLSITLQVKLLDSFNSNLFLLEEDLIGLGGEIIGKLLDVIGEGGREENVLNSRRKHPSHQLVVSHMETAAHL
jgi:hypothetical protein